MKDYSCKDNVKERYSKCPKCASSVTEVVKYSDGRISHKLGERSFHNEGSNANSNQ